MRMSSNGQEDNNKDTFLVNLEHLDIITIAGRSFLYKSKSGIAVDSYKSRDQRDTNELDSALNKSNSNSEFDDEIDSMSLDSRSSRRSICSQVSTSTVMGTCGDNVFGHLYLLNKDGTESSPYSLRSEITIGR